MSVHLSVYSNFQEPIKWMGHLFSALRRSISSLHYCSRRHHTGSMPGALYRRHLTPLSGPCVMHRSHRVRDITWYHKMSCARFQRLQANPLNCRRYLNLLDLHREQWILWFLQVLLKFYIFLLTRNIIWNKSLCWLTKERFRIVYLFCIGTTASRNILSKIPLPRIGIVAPSHLTQGKPIDR